LPVKLLGLLARGGHGARSAALHLLFEERQRGVEAGLRAEPQHASRERVCEQHRVAERLVRALRLASGSARTKKRREKRGKKQRKKSRPKRAPCQCLVRCLRAALFSA
jgi:hypothetical protein